MFLSKKYFYIILGDITFQKYIKFVLFFPFFDNKYIINVIMCMCHISSNICINNVCFI